MALALCDALALRLALCARLYIYPVEPLQNRRLEPCCALVRVCLCACEVCVGCVCKVCTRSSVMYRERNADLSMVRSNRRLCRWKIRRRRTSCRFRWQLRTTRSRKLSMHRDVLLLQPVVQGESHRYAQERAVDSGQVYRAHGRTDAHRLPPVASRRTMSTPRRRLPQSSGRLWAQH